MSVRHVTVTAAFAAVTLFALLLSGVAAPPQSATVRFGLNEVGSPFPPPAGHDHSTHAKDHIVPRTVVIAQGGSVTFEIDEFHQPALYRPGTAPEDITVSDATLQDLSLPCVPGGVLPKFVINDPNGRILLGPPHSCAEQTWTTPPGTFDHPGRYLVICTTLPHFRNGMYGWVIVQ